MRILFVSPYLPSRIRIRPYGWISSLTRLGHDVHLVALAPPDDPPAAADEMRRLCTAVDVFPLGRLRTLASALLAVPHPGTPLQLAYSHHPDAERHVAALAASGRYDVVHIEHMRGVALASRVRGLPVVFDAVDCISALFAEAARHAGTWRARLIARLDLQRSRRFEARAPLTFSRVVVTSAREAHTFVELAGRAARERVDVVTNGVDTEYFTPAEHAGARAVLFTGKLSYHANAAAAHRLVERVMPAVWAARPDTPVILAGKDPPPAVQALGRDPRVRITGYLTDMREVFREAAVAVCPLVYGAGIQNKVLEALASGVATVVTPAVASALSGRIGEDYLDANSDEAFASAILGLLADSGRRKQLAAAGRAYVVAHHQWDALTAALVQVYQRAIDSSSPPA